MLNREMWRDVCGVVSAAAVCGAGTAFGAEVGAVSGETRAAPNIVYILTDDLGWGDLSCYGQTNWETPRLDEMAREGMLFTNAYAGSTVCAPSRAALLTGNHTGRVWQRGNGDVSFRRDPHDITIATRLRDAGYRTAMIGKSGVACNSADETLPNDKGFDHFYGILAHGAAHRNYPEKAVMNGRWVEFPGNEGYTGTTYANMVWVEDALRWMGESVREEPGQPFFLHLSITPPHADLTVPERYMEPFRGRFEESANERGGYYKQKETRAAYAGMVAFIDESVGRVLDRIEELGVAEETVVFFASDNGPHYEGGGDADFFDSNGPLRGGKRAMFEGGIRTPQLVWWPGTVEAGSRTDVITAFWDFAPTALDLAGLPAVESMDGVSIAATLTGRSEEQVEHEYLYWEFYEQGGKQAVRMGDWKGIRRDVNMDRDGPIELYDLRTDIGETTDVSARHPEVVARIAAAMEEAHTPSELFRFGGQHRARSRAKGERRLKNGNDAYVLDRGGFVVMEVSSVSAFNGRVGENALDDDIDSVWHTEWRDAQPEHPHTMTIDLGGVYDVRGVRLMARQDGEHNGTIERLRISVASSPAELDGVDATARLRFTKDEQEVLLDKPERGRYVRLETRSAFRGSPHACIANLEVLGTRVR